MPWSTPSRTPGQKMAKRGARKGQVRGPDATLRPGSRLLRPLEARRPGAGAVPRRHGRQLRRAGAGVADQMGAGPEPARRGASGGSRRARRSWRSCCAGRRRRPSAPRNSVIANILDFRPDLQMAISTAVALSARFPYVTPPANIKRSDKIEPPTGLYSDINGAGASRRGLLRQQRRLGGHRSSRRPGALPAAARAGDGTGVRRSSRSSPTTSAST